MPRLFDSIALTLALSSCAPIGPNSGPNGRHAATPDQIRASISATTAPAPAPTADGFECKSVQNAVKNDITRCCLIIAPHKACREMETSAAAEFSKKNTVEAGGGRIPNYAFFKDGIPPAMYMNYLAHAAKNATELAGALTKFVSYREIQDDNLLPPEEIISQGAGDCDNMANLFVDLLGKLGKKTGFDYKAKVIGLEDADHAVAIFLDTDGKLKALDFNLPFHELRQADGKPDLFSASNNFETNRKAGKNFFERRKLGAAAGRGARIDQFIDAETMAPSGKDMALAVDLDYRSDINPDLFLKDYNWRQTELTHIHYKNGTTAYYRKGLFFQLTEQDKITMYNENKVATEIQYKNNPTIKIEYYSATGHLERRDLKNGDSELYSNGVLFQRVYATGPVDYRVYRANGTISQLNYKDGKIEWFDENGRMTHRRDKRGKVTVFKFPTRTL